MRVIFTTLGNFQVYIFYFNLFASKQSVNATKMQRVKAFEEAKNDTHCQSFKAIQSGRNLVKGNLIWNIYQGTEIAIFIHWTFLNEGNFHVPGSFRMEMIIALHKFLFYVALSKFWHFSTLFSSLFQHSFTSTHEVGNSLSVLNFLGSLSSMFPRNFSCLCKYKFPHISYFSLKFLIVHIFCPWYF